MPVIDLNCEPHTLLDLRGNIPTFIHVSTDKLHDVNLLDTLLPEAGAFYIIDRAYLDFERLHLLTMASAFFVIRAKSNLKFRRVYSQPIDKSIGLRCDQIGVLYKCRWQVELFFKWVKQHLRIKSFFGTSENAVVICCTHERDALRVRKALAGRLARYKPALNEQKTRLVNFARPRSDHSRPGVFDFLRFTFYWGRSRKGVPLPKVKTSGKRMRAKLKAVSDVRSTGSGLPCS